MSSNTANLLAEALQLPEADRADVAIRLIESLDPITENDTEDAWSTELQTRIEDLRDGRAKPLSWPEARRYILEEGDDTTPT